MVCGATTIKWLWEWKYNTQVRGFWMLSNSVYSKKHKFVPFPSGDQSIATPPLRWASRQEIFSVMFLKISTGAVRLMKIPAFWDVTVSLDEKLLVFRIQYNPSTTHTVTQHLIPWNLCHQHHDKNIKHHKAYNPQQKLDSSHSLVNVRCGPWSLA
jgi:hypothetical protein